ncbi:hypothetical protein F3Y22_tig00110402pilonHSYRG00223 [Hibiscus syriacus]|uniref:Uncharacterized protein n=1 Tax=Hibiscus syriacus TaxID=106335 RepID=A0A6A3ATB6_HIBSY|nr:hypothetical protein F3Y22_tig00110402pilonHSYRG00223 [Hibiscus syriacus]
MAREICDDKSKNDIVVSSAGFCFSDVSPGNSTMQTHLVNQIQSFVNEWTTEFCQPEFTTDLPETGTENLIVGTESAHWQENRLLVVDDSSLRCVFPCEGNERPSQGLSLSLSSTNPTGIGLQSFELRQTCHGYDDMRFIGSSSSRDGFTKKPANLHHQGQFQLRNSKYLGPARDLLNEFCSLGNKQIMLDHKLDPLWEPKPKPKLN